MILGAMTKKSPFDEVKPRTPRGEARQRAVKVMRAMEELVEIADEDEFSRRLAERFGILPGDARYQNAVSIWRELQRGKL
jgi:hypothetical protein